VPRIKENQLRDRARAAESEEYEKRASNEKRPCSGMLQGRFEYGTAQRDI
jgi:hypothetical protein